MDMCVLLHGLFSDVREDKRVLSVCMHVCVCVADVKLEGCVGRGFLCWHKLISRIQTTIAAFCRESHVLLYPFMSGKCAKLCVRLCGGVYVCVHVRQEEKLETNYGCVVSAAILNRKCQLCSP